MAAFRSPIQAVIVAREVLEPLGATLTMGGDHRRGVINVSTFGRLYPITVSVIPGTTRPSPARTEAVVRGLAARGIQVSAHMAPAPGPADHALG